MKELEESAVSRHGGTRNCLRGLIAVSEVIRKIQSLSLEVSDAGVHAGLAHPKTTTAAVDSTEA